MPYPYSSQSHTATASVGPFSYSNVSLLSDVPVKDQIKVYLNGQLKVLTTDYTLTANETVTFNSAVTGTVKIARESDIENKEVTFTNSSVLTAQDLNKNTDQLLFLCQELYDKAQLISLTPVGSIADDSIGSNLLNKTAGSEAVVTTAIFNAAVTTAKIADDAVTVDKIADGAVQTAQIQDGAITDIKIAASTIASGKLTTGGPTWTSTAVTAPDDMTVTDDLSVGGDVSITGNLSFNSGYGSSVMSYGCRAWVNFDGNALGSQPGGNWNVVRVLGSTTATFTSTTSHGFLTGHWIYMGTGQAIAQGWYSVINTGTTTFTVTTVATTAVSSAISSSFGTVVGSGNVHSIARGAAGEYRVNFAAAMPDAYYSAMATGSFSSGNGTFPAGTGSGIEIDSDTYSAVSFGMVNRNNSNTAIISEMINVAVFR